MLLSAKGNHEWREPQVDLLCPGFHVAGGGAGYLRVLCVATVQRMWSTQSSATTKITLGASWAVWSTALVRTHTDFTPSRAPKP